MFSNETPKAYIIDTYNPYNHKQNECAVYKCKINEMWLAVYAVELYFGEPILDGWPIDRSEFDKYHIYGTAREAKHYLSTLRDLEGTDR